jgi:hypothetical protein
MRIGKLSGAIASFLVIMSAGCAGPPPGPEPEWATLDRYDFNVAEAEPNLTIPASHLYERIYFSRAAAAGGRVTDSVIQFQLDSILIDTLVSLTTDQYDLRRHWLRYMEFRESTSAWLRNTYWNRQLGDRVKIDSQDVIDYYNAHPASFSIPEQAEIYHILSSPLGFLQGPDSALYFRFSREDLHAYSEDYIWQLYDLIRYGEAFENVAQRFSHDVKSRDFGGRLGWVLPGTYIDPFDSVAFSLKDGEVSRPYQDADGWHLLYRTNYHSGGPEPLDSANIYNRAATAAFDSKVAKLAPAVLDSLRSEAEVEVNDLYYSTPDLMTVDDTLWAAVVNTSDTVYFHSLKLLVDDYGVRLRLNVNSDEVRRAMLATNVGPMVVLQAARFEGYDTLPEYIAYRDATLKTTIKYFRLTQLYGTVEWQPSEEEIASYYKKHWDDYHPRKHIQAEQLVVKDPELAYFLREQAGQGMSLTDLLAAFGPEGEGYDIVYENLGIVEEGKLPGDLEDALKRTHAYRLTPVVQTARGYHLARVLKRDYDKTLDMVRGGIRSILIDQYRWEQWREFRDKLFAQQKVTFPGKLPSFTLPRLADRNHPRTLPIPRNVGIF